MLSKISSSATINPTAWINPENVTIEDGAKIGPFCAIGVEGINVEKEFLVIGGNEIRKSRGKILIKRNSDVGAHAIVGLALGKDDATIIGENVITGGACIIGHDSQVGDNTILTSRVSLMGHVKIGKNCWIGPGAVISNRIEIGDDAKISIGSVVTKNVENGKRVTGNFAIEHDQFIENLRKSRDTQAQRKKG